MNRFGLKDDVIEFIAESASRHNLEKVVLFGSRAKGNFSEKSDIDLAILGSSTHEFIDEVEEKCPTLLPFDFIDLSCGVSSELQERISQEGVVLYG